jgi:hypothetical protein
MLCLFSETKDVYLFLYVIDNLHIFTCKFGISELMVWVSTIIDPLSQPHFFIFLFSTQTFEDCWCTPYRIQADQPLKQKRVYSIFGHC